MTLKQRTVTLTLEWDDNPALYFSQGYSYNPANPLHRNDPGDDADYWECQLNGEYSGPRLAVVSVTSTPVTAKE